MPSISGGWATRFCAIDWSPEMAEEASRRIRASGLERKVEVRNLGIHELDRLEGRTFDGAYSEHSDPSTASPTSPPRRAGSRNG